MNNRLICLEGTLDFEEEIHTQSINIISFRQGQQITINRDRLPAGRTFAQQISLQLDNAHNIFHQFSLVKMLEMNEDDLFADAIQIIFTFNTGNGQKVWQVTFAVCLDGKEIINFTSVYPDEESMENEVWRLRHCITNFVLSTGR